MDPLAEPVLLAEALTDVLMFTGGDIVLRRPDAYDRSPLGWSAATWDLLSATLAREWNERRDRDPSGSLLDELEEDLDLTHDFDGGISVLRIAVDVEEMDPSTTSSRCDKCRPRTLV